MPISRPRPCDISPLRRQGFNHTFTNLLLIISRSVARGPMKHVISTCLLTMQLILLALFSALALTTRDPSYLTSFGIPLCPVRQLSSRLSSPRHKTPPYGHRNIPAQDFTDTTPFQIHIPCTHIRTETKTPNSTSILLEATSSI